MPFKFGKVVQDDFFVNRESEIHHISNLLGSGINVTLISPRRWGKSSLLFKIGREMEKKNPGVRFCFIDLFQTRSEEEFYAYFATEVIRASYSKWDERMEQTKNFFKQIIPRFSFGLDPQEQFSLSFDWEEVKRHPNEILDLPEKISIQKNIRLIVCLDEFQNIAHYDEDLAFQKKLRAVWQRHQHCTYALYGSKQHMMAELFENKSMPFYKFGEILFLDKIDNDHWRRYISRKFRKSDKKISAKLAGKVADLVDNHPYFVQQLANAVWLHTDEVCTEDEIKQGLNHLLTQYDMFFSREVDMLSNLQLNLLKAIAWGEDQLTAKSTIKKYKLSSSASVIRSREALVQKEVIDIFNQRIEFLDPLFGLWIRSTYQKP
ncbi:AAA family ATPase [Aureitalea marina]|uniref:ATPase domain-containing protein n=1 Tax=Aureitalea marina TaxID=930804 RepID=A0A2S7KPY0_9FLAO|nr:ATP-binding protein [Aureitalea marina]PQB04686.1 hypothetical protein BST85_07095 [Aureitalea marina]